MQDEFKNFDPREFWAETNNEELAFYFLEKQSKERQAKVMAVIEVRAATSKEISNETGLKPSVVVQAIKKLKRKFKVSTDRTKNGIFYQLHRDCDP